jgi:hypothetical protein
MQGMEASMQRVMMVVLVMMLLTVFVAVPGQAARQGPPQGTCAPGFEMHHFMDHQEHHEHHIALAEDLNQDGYICVLHLPNGLHVHVDNVLPY